MSKHYTKEEKLQMLKNVENLGCVTAGKMMKKRIKTFWEKNLLNLDMTCNPRVLKEKVDPNL